MPGDVPGSANNCSGYFTGSEDPGTGLPGNGLVTNNYSGYYPRRSFRPDLPGRPINPNNSSGCFPVRRCAPVSPGFFLFRWWISRQKTRTSLRARPPAKRRGQPAACLLSQVTVACSGSVVLSAGVTSIILDCARSIK